MQGEASGTSMAPLYTDDAPWFSARQYAGCFSVDQVRRLLHQPLPPRPPCQKLLEQVGNAATNENHFLSTCHCAPLHDRCRELDSSRTTSRDWDTTIDVTLDQLRKSSEQTCWFCGVVYGGISTAPPWDPYLEENASIRPLIRIRAKGRESPELIIYAFGDNERTQEPRPEFYIDQTEGKHVHLPEVRAHTQSLTTVYFFLATSSPCKLLQCKTEPDRIACHEQLEFIAHHLKDCIQAHSCVSSEPTFMPTRLIRIVVDNHNKYVTRLVTETSLQPYVALSHCWGKVFPAYAKTTLVNLDARELCLPWEELPQTFRDAVAVTERLGFQYIWIDALCIIQDSPSDWESEASSMCDVYSSCALLLSADASPDSEVGLFRAANMSTRPWSADIPASWKSPGVKVQYPRVHFTFGKMPSMYVPSWKQLTIYPLSTRAWCFQEQRLARRVVHFAVDEVMWDCLGGVACQCGTFSSNSFALHTWQKKLVDNECSADEKHSLWINTVSEYSSRELSHWTDRFPALSGLAKQFQVTSDKRQFNNIQVSTPDNGFTQQVTGKFKDISLGTYLAGAWSSSLLVDMCWSADDTPGQRISTPSCYIAPSWSWASISGMVNSRSSPHEPLAEIISAHCIPTGTDDTGRISYGEVVLKARIMPVTIFRGQVLVNRGTRLKYEYLHLEARDSQTGEQRTLGQYRPDCYQSPEDIQFHVGADTIWGRGSTSRDDLIPMDGKYFGLQLTGSFVMVVRPVSEERNTFERVGSIGCETSKCFGETEPHVIKLI